MKKIHCSPLKNESPVPDLSRRPRGLHLEQIVEVPGFSKLKLRPIQLQDESKMVAFHEGLTPKSICFRYFGYLGLDRRTSHGPLVRVCTNTEESYSIVIEQPAHSRKAGPKILAIGRLIKTPEPYVAMFDLLVGNEADIPKLSGILLKRLIYLGRAFRFQIFASRLLTIDKDAINLCRSLGFVVHSLREEGFTQVLLKL